MAASISSASSLRSRTAAGVADSEPGACISSSKLVEVSTAPFLFNKVYEVFRTIVSNQALPLPPRNPPKDRNARI
jgi:hypothetical protein